MGGRRELPGGWREEAPGVTVQWVQLVFGGAKGFGNGGHGCTTL